MAIQNVIVIVFVLNLGIHHNGGGVGWGEVMAGFGMVLDGSKEANAIAQCFSGM
jgi:urocanate hydratase